MPATLVGVVVAQCPTEMLLPCARCILLAIISALVMANADGQFRDLPNIAFVILSQSEPYHAKLATHLKYEITKQSEELELEVPNIHLTHEDFKIPGSWTLLSLLEPLAKKYITNYDVHWIFICNQHTAINYSNLVNILSKYNYNEGIWMGYPLKDLQPTIIHHFSQSSEMHSITYPNLASGFVVSSTLLRRLYERILNGDLLPNKDFFIDPTYELAAFIRRKSQGPILTPVRKFCLKKNPDCASYPLQFNACGTAIPESSIFFAVKTYHKNHLTRVPVIKETWGKYVSNIMFFSNIKDQMLPSITLNIENSDQGHCNKTIAILKFIKEVMHNNSAIKWAVLADDDTIMSVARLCEVLSCMPRKEVPTIVGERYGYGYGHRHTHTGYDYITGGGGIVLSTAAVNSLSDCSCPAMNTPDDMWLGACAQRHVNVSLVHSHLFHQARPIDYARDYLATDRPVSFHKHWMIDPLLVYDQWFQEHDKAFYQTHGSHSEL